MVIRNYCPPICEFRANRKNRASLQQSTKKAPDWMNPGLLRCSIAIHHGRIAAATGRLKLGRTLRETNHSWDESIDSSG
jgi:hypothetical protein